MTDVSKIKILVIGSEGQVGKSLCKLFVNSYNLLALNKKQLDLQDINSIKPYLKKFRPDIIINAAAFTNVELAEKKETVAFELNSNALEDLSNVCKERSIILIHFSTDYVFDGKKSQPYIETDNTNPLSIYGKSKLNGEKKIINSKCKHIILRISWVYSQEKNNFPSFIIEQAIRNKEMKIIDDQYGIPVSANFVAENIKLIIDKISENNFTKFQSAIYHLTPNGSTNWYNFAKYILNKLIEQNIIKKDQIYLLKKISSIEYTTNVKRPKNSVLNSNKISKVFNLKFKNWETYVDDFIKNYF